MKRKIIIISLVVIFLILAIVLLMNLNKNSKKDINEILVQKKNYNYPYLTVIEIDMNGDILRSKIIDELTLEGKPQHNFSKIGTTSEEELIKIKNIIEEMKKETLKSSNFSENYGISVNIGEDTLYGGEYFSQEDVDKLNAIIQKYE